ncbi:MAG: 3-isopropylmalate dehydratase large subunit [Deltaproteobacteria bacterium]|jgi:3-isopropylmalate/(R)-2-methylmalate dehydratase large subunit|nr:3-isopropylmalate dehydratase large subunit [Deltaproteobacteria bacterium]
MPLTLAQKILAAHSLEALDGEEALPGRILACRVDLVLANDITAPLAINSFREMKAEKVFDREKIVLVMDHFVPQKDIASAEQVLISRRFAAEQDLPLYFEGGEAGVEHALLPELGLVGPGDLVVGADSHTCTYGGLGAFATGMGSTDVAAAMALGESWFKVPASIRVNCLGSLPEHVGGKDLILWTIGRLGVDGARYMALEFDGPAISALDVEGRLTMANMAIEAGGKAGLFAADEATLAYCRKAGRTSAQTLAADPGANSSKTLTLDASGLEPLVACPHLPENVRPVSELKGIPVQQVIIGSCTNGRISDLRAAAAVLKGRKVQKGLRCIVLPATPGVWKQAIREGLAEILLEAGCILGPPSCGPCLGGHLGILAGGERALSTTNRNFKGRMGSLDSEVYLANPAVAAATAVAGEIAHPGKI